MKKFIKNTLLSFVIIFTVLNLLFFANIMVLRNTLLREVVTLYLSENRDVEACIQAEQDALEQINEMKELYGEDVPATAVAGVRTFLVGMDQVLDNQAIILVATLVFSIAIGIILSLTEKSKTKAIVYFISIGLTLAVLYTTYFHLTRNLPDTKFFEGFMENFIDTINTYGIYYMVIYVLVYIGRYIVDKKKMKELNKEIEKKNK